MKRRSFIQNSSALGFGSLVAPNLLFSKHQSYWRLVSYLIPILASEGIKYIFDSFGKNGENTDDAVDKSITNIINNNFNVSEAYKEHYNNVVKGKIDTKKLNGVGYDGDDYKMASVINDFNDRTSTPIHSIRNLSHFNKDVWSKYCDVSHLQISASSGRVWVTPKDTRDDKYKETYWTPERFSYLLYNPKYYCYGLPCGNPQIHYVDETLQRQILAKRKAEKKTEKQTTTKSYYTQRFLFRGNDVCENPQDEFTTIYWDHDNVLREHFDLITIKPCGNPLEECHGDNPAKRPPERQ